MSEVSPSTKDRKNEKPQSWKVMNTNCFFQSIPPEEIMMRGKKCSWRPEILLKGNLPFLLWLPFAIKNKQQLR